MSISRDSNSKSLLNSPELKPREYKKGSTVIFSILAQEKIKPLKS